MHGEGISRAAFLRGAAGVASVGALAALGIGGEASAAEPGGPGEPRPAARQPVESGWSPKTPRLSTPWTDQVSPRNARGEYPRPQLARADWTSLNGVWQFAALAEGERPAPGVGLAERILVPYPVESALSGIMRTEAHVAYRRRFVVPPSWRVGTRGKREQRLLIHLDGTDYRAEVLVNGHSLGVHQGAYDRFTVDVTDALITGPDGKVRGEQELTVLVDDPTENGDQPLGKQRLTAADPSAPHSALYYTPVSGIWQPVWMEPVPAAHVGGLVVVPDIDARTATVTLDMVGGAADVRLVLFDGERPVADVRGRSDRPLVVPVPGMRLWSPDDPFLYRLEVEAGGRDGDRVRHLFGMRTVAIKEVGGAPRIVLNGRFLPQIGCLQQGFWPDGVYTAATDDALRFDVQEARDLGFTTIRKHQKVEPDRWYHWADRLGVLVWQDMPATATGRQPPHQAQPSQPPAAGKAEFERELRRVVEQLRCFSSIVMWIPFNEGWGAYDLARVADEVRGWDPTRIVNEMSGTNVAQYSEGGGQVADVHNLGAHWPGPVPEPGPGQASIIGEFGAFAYVPQGHEWLPGKSRPNQSVDGATGLTDTYVQALQAIAGFVRDEGLSGANYNLFEDAELQVNGLYTYDRQIFKASDRARIVAANRAVVAQAERLG